jgi:hypothetical protein
MAAAAGRIPLMASTGGDNPIIEMELQASGEHAVWSGMFWLSLVSVTFLLLSNDISMLYRT